MRVSYALYYYGNSEVYVLYTEHPRKIFTRPLLKNTYARRLLYTNVWIITLLPSINL
jgi:hypothetical protein